MTKAANKPIIAVDIDEVLFPMVPDLISYLDKKHKITLSQEDFIKYSLEEIWKGDPTEAANLFESYKSQVGIEVAPVKGAAEALKRLASDYHLIVMTSRDIKVESITQNWLNRHFPQLFGAVHLLGNRLDSVNYREKAEVCKELGVYCLIDDSLNHVITTHNSGIKSILFGNYPWNQIAELPSGLPRVANWDGVLKILV